MPAWISWLIAGFGTAGFAIWFLTARRELSTARKNIETAYRQVQQHTDSFRKLENGAYEEADSVAMSTSCIIFWETVTQYNRTRRSFKNRLPALLMGFSPFGEKAGRGLRLYGLRPFVLPGGEEELPVLREKGCSRRKKPQHHMPVSASDTSENN